LTTDVTGKIILLNGASSAGKSTLAKAITTPFNQVDPQFTSDEGEGDRSLAYWRNAHWAFFESYCRKMGMTQSEEMPLVCERFRVIKGLGNWE
jgi:uncharacterized protein YhfF